MKTIITDNFLLNNDVAKELYHDHAAKMPIIDYHCHLDARLIASDHRFESVGELMLAGDHYKWRAMRSFGIEERLITGDADYREKFRAFARVMPYLIGNPLYHWTHLELARYFDVYEALTERTADAIFDQCEKKIALGGFSAKELILRSGVEVICTTDDPSDDLAPHQRLAAEGFPVKVLPTFRPDKAINIHKDTFLPYIAQTGAKDLPSLLSWLTARIDFFHAAGCRLADHGLDFVPYAEGDASAVFEKALRGESITEKERDIYMTSVLLHCARAYAARAWCMQLHVGALRNNNTRAYRALGADTGYDSIAETAIAGPTAKLLDALEGEDALPKTILYSLNPKDNYVLGTLIGCFQDASVKSKLQLGSGWWFNDQKDGMEAQLCALGNLGVLGAFVGMLTDSRSFLSYPRHEYFRRILCNLLGSWVDAGLYPYDKEALFAIVEGICYKNAKEYFAF